MHFIQGNKTVFSSWILYILYIIIEIPSKSIGVLKMEDILKKLFEGRLKLNFQDTGEIPEYRTARREILKREESFRAGLTSQQQKTYEILMQKTLEAEYLLTVEAFRRGFSIAVQLINASVYEGLQKMEEI